MSDVRDQPAAAEEADSAARRLVFRLSSGALVAAALNVVLELDLPDLLSQGPQSVDSLASRVQLRPDLLYRLMRSMAAVGVFVEAPDRTFGLTPASRLLLRSTNTLRATTGWLTSPFYQAACAELLYSMRTGQPSVVKSAGAPLFEVLEQRPDLAAMFHESLSEVDAPYLADIAASLGSFGRSVVVDIGGGTGDLLAAILRRVPDASGVLYDLPLVVGRARAKQGSEFESRCRVEAGDFFAEVPAGGDVYLMKRVIHDWDDDDATTILNRVRSVMPEEGARLFVIESVRAPRSHIRDFFDLHMMLTLGGRERELDEFERLLRRSGFAPVHVHTIAHALWVIEAVPA